MSLFTFLKGKPPVTPLPILGPFETAVNIAEDLWAKGTPSYASPIHFKAPAGYRTRILGVRGDFIAWPQKSSVLPGTSCEVGWGLKNTSPDPSASSPSKWVDYPGYPQTGGPYDNTAIWLQDMLTPAKPQSRIHYDHEFTEFYLNADNLLLSQAFIALDSTGLTLHMEPTFAISFQFEPL